MRRTLLLTVSLALVAACAPRPEIRPLLLHDDVRQQDAAGDDYGAGKEHLVAGRLGLAVERFRAAIARNGRDVAGLNALAACYDRLGRFDLADRYYDRALALAPADPQTLNNAGVSNLMRGRAAQAVALLEKARRQAPDDARIAANLARAAALAEIRVAESDPEDVDLPSRLQRAGLNAWQLRMRPEPVASAWVQPVVGKGEEPPPPMAAPRPAVERVDLLPPNPSVEKVQTQVQVVNGVGRRGMARRLRSVLARHGVNASTGDAPRFDVAHSVLSYPPGRKAEAEQLARLFPASIRLEAARTSSRALVLVLGRDFVPHDQPAQTKGS